MSLIADALKKAQASQLGRRYVTAKPAGVLPVAGKGGQSGWRASLDSILKGDHRNTTLVLGLATGTVFFLMLFFYFFYGPGRSIGSSSATRTASIQRPPQDLVLRPPPALATLDPVKLEEEEVLPAAEPTAGPSQPLPAHQQDHTAEEQVGKPTDRAPLIDSKVSVTSDQSEQLRSSFNRGLLYQKEKKFDLARQEYEKVIKRWPLYAEAHNNLGLVFKELGSYAQAISEFKRALELNPGYVRAYLNLGVIFHLRGDLKQATENYLSALALDRGNVSALNNLGLVYRDEKRDYDAKNVLEKALRLNPNSPETQYNLALVLEEIGDKQSAREHFERFLMLAGKDKVTLAQKVEEHLRGETAKAKAGP